uniref:RAD9-HUS1-RAD1 interacting nuclear orphan 1 n=1 Tax=Leptobrachium leishanense TaxID=445787 RepID=A0A8C5N4V8_9ANUR
MPRRKRTTCNPLKSRLVFLESPKPGLLHEYGPHPEKASPVSVPSRRLDHSKSVSWVSPQFETLPINFPGCCRQQHTSTNGTLCNHSRDTNIKKSTAAKAGACKFPSLSFTNKAVPDNRLIKQRCSRRRSSLPMHSKAMVVLAHSTAPHESSYCGALTPPDIQTPDKSLQCNQSIQSPRESRTLCLEQSEKCDRLNTSLEKEPVRVLAEDTPEHEYGIRVTWRRRQPLMRYLKEHGKLEHNQILVKR